MSSRSLLPFLAGFVAVGVACSGDDDTTSSSRGTTAPPAVIQSGPKAGNPDGKAAIPSEGEAEAVSAPTTVVGTGTAASCTGDAFVDAVAKGGVITFDCGADPVTITLTKTAKIWNDKGPRIVIDGGGKVTLSGGGKVRILYLSTCDDRQKRQQGDCNKTSVPALTVQNLTFVDGSAKGLAEGDKPGDDKSGGGAIYAQGGLLKVVNSRFFNNVCDDLASDIGGGAIRKLDYLADGKGDRTRKVWIVNSTFGGEGPLANACANGGALSSIGISWTILNSVFIGNRAIGNGANDGNGGNGGAIYNDGRNMMLSVEGTIMRNNKANEGGSAIFFVSNDKTGAISIKDSMLTGNPRGTFETQDFPGLFVIASAKAEIVNSTLEH